MTFLMFLTDRNITHFRNVSDFFQDIFILFNQWNHAKGDNNLLREGMRVKLCIKISFIYFFKGSAIGRKELVT